MELKEAALDAEIKKNSLKKENPDFQNLTEKLRKGLEKKKKKELK
jgi:hypothetical protein